MKTKHYIFPGLHPSPCLVSSSSNSLSPQPTTMHSKQRERNIILIKLPFPPLSSFLVFKFEFSVASCNIFFFVTGCCDYFAYLVSMSCKWASESTLFHPFLPLWRHDFPFSLPSLEAWFPFPPPSLEAWFPFLPPPLEAWFPFLPPLSGGMIPLSPSLSGGMISLSPSPSRGMIFLSPSPSGGTISLSLTSS